MDINPLAVEMAKLSMWLLTLAKDKPFTFLDHSIRCGDSLVGIHDLRQLKRFSDTLIAVEFGLDKTTAMECAAKLLATDKPLREG